MAQLLFEGTVEEMVHRLTEYKEEFSGVHLQIFASPEMQEKSKPLGFPPSTIRDREHLETLLSEAIQSSKTKVTEEDWGQIRSEVKMRLAERGERT